jgi:hypothetical protein
MVTIILVPCHRDDQLPAGDIAHGVPPALCHQSLGREGPVTR